jgi:hypothetical protein
LVVKVFRIRKKDLAGIKKCVTLPSQSKKTGGLPDRLSGKKQFFSVVIKWGQSGPGMRNLLTYSLSCALFGGCEKGKSSLKVWKQQHVIF